MEVIPAIDIREGKCVQLVGGDISRETLRTDVHSQVNHFISHGAKRLHVVDLDRAMGIGDNQKHIQKILAENKEVSIQVGGGIRTLNDIYRYLSEGADRVITGTKAIENPAWLYEASSTFPGKLITAIDARNEQVVTHGWQSTTDIHLYQASLMAEENGAAGVFYTDVDREGLLKGPNVLRCFDLTGILNIEVLASGGIRNQNDIADLSEAEVDGVVVGTAAYTGQLALEGLFE